MAQRVANEKREKPVVGAVDKELLQGHGGPRKLVHEERLELALGEMQQPRDDAGHGGRRPRRGAGARAKHGRGPQRVQRDNGQRPRVLDEKHGAVADLRPVVLGRHRRLAQRAAGRQARLGKRARVVVQPRRRGRAVRLRRHRQALPVRVQTRGASNGRLQVADGARRRQAGQRSWRGRRTRRQLHAKHPFVARKEKDAERTGGGEGRPKCGRQADCVESEVHTFCYDVHAARGAAVEKFHENFVELLLNSHNL